MSTGLLVAGAVGAYLLLKPKPTTLTPQIIGTPPSPASEGQSWVWHLSGFAPNSPLSVTCTTCGGNTSPITEPITDDVTYLPVSTDSSGSATVTSIIGVNDFGTWVIQVSDAQGNHTGWFTYTITAVIGTLSASPTTLPSSGGNVTLTLNTTEPDGTMLYLFGYIGGNWIILLNQTVLGGIATFTYPVPPDTLSSVETWQFRVSDNQQGV